MNTFTQNNPTDTQNRISSNNTNKINKTISNNHANYNIETDTNIPLYYHKTTLTRDLINKSPCFQNNSKDKSKSKSNYK